MVCQLKDKSLGNDKNRRGSFGIGVIFFGNSPTLKSVKLKGPRNFIGNQETKNSEKRFMLVELLAWTRIPDKSRIT